MPGVPVEIGRAGGSSSASLASFTPTAGALVFAMVSGKSIALPSEPILSDGGGRSWSLVTGFDQTEVNQFANNALYVHEAGASPAAGSLSVTVTGAASTALVVVEVSDASSDLSNQAVAVSTTGDPAAALSSAPASDSAILAFAAAHPGNAFTTTGATELIDGVPSGATNHRCLVAYDNTSPGSSVILSSTNTGAALVLLELKAPAAPPAGTTLTVAVATVGYTPQALALSQRLPLGTAAASYAGQPVALGNAGGAPTTLAIDPAGASYLGQPVALNAQARLALGTASAGYSAAALQLLQRQPVLVASAPYAGRPVAVYTNNAPAGGGQRWLRLGYWMGGFGL